MKNEGFKQANALANWFESNDIDIDDVTINIKLKDDSLFKIMSDGSIMKISSDTSDNTVFANATEAINSFDGKKVNDSKTFIIKVRRK